MKDNLNIINMGDIVSKEVDWLLKPYIPYGKITIIQGDPGEGKTTFALMCASYWSKGLTFNNSTSEEIKIIYQSAEDGLSDTIKPRLEKLNANCSNIFIIDESKSSLNILDKRIEEAIIQTGARVCIFDPLQAYLGEKVDMNRANEVRSVMRRIGTIAEKHNCAIIFIGHMNKGSGAKASYRGIGSIDIFAIARSVLLVGKVPDNNEIRAIVQIKNSLEKIGNSVAYQFTNGEINWLGEYAITEDELLNFNTFSQRDTKAELGKRLIENLAEKRAKVPSTEIVQMAKENNISKRTVDNLKSEMQIDSEKIGNKWYWIFNNATMQ